MGAVSTKEYSESDSQSDSEGSTNHTAICVPKEGTTPDGCRGESTSEPEQIRQPKRAKWKWYVSNQIGTIIVLW